MLTALLNCALCGAPLDWSPDPSVVSAHGDAALYCQRKKCVSKQRRLEAEARRADESAERVQSKPRKKARSRPVTLAGGFLPRESALATLRRLKVDPAKLNPELLPYISGERPLPSRGKFDRPATTKIHLNDLDPAATLRPDDVSDKSARFQSFSHNKSLAGTPVEFDAGTDEKQETHSLDEDLLAAGLTPVSPRHERYSQNPHATAAPWWLENAEFFERLIQHWHGSAETKRDKREAELNAAVLRDYYERGMSDGQIFEARKAEFKSIKRKSRYCRNADGVRIFRHRLLDEGTALFSPGSTASGKEIRRAEKQAAKADPTYADRRAKWELWREIREKSDGDK